jgi:hypothetical protein
MAKYSVWILEESNITVSGGKSLDGITQGDGSHLVDETITLDNDNWVETKLRDDDQNFDDNDAGQTLDGKQTINDTEYSDGTKVEAEYEIVLEDGEGNTYDAIAYNINNSSPAYATNEGLAFVGPPQGWPPQGVELTVVSASEGPGSLGQEPTPQDDLVVPCFTPGTLIDTPDGPCPVEALCVGSPVTTLDSGARPVRWIGRVTLSAGQLAADPSLRPVRVCAGAMGPGQPARDMLLSPQHRLLVSGWRAELLVGEPSVLAPVKHLVNDTTITIAHDVAEVTYIHFMFDRHEVVHADGLAAESFLPGPVTLPALDGAARDELFKLFPELEDEAADWPHPARPCVKAWEAALLAA